MSALAWSIFAGADSDQNTNPAVRGVMLEATEWRGGLAGQGACCK